MAHMDYERPLEVRTLSSRLENPFKDIPIKQEKVLGLKSRLPPLPPSTRSYNEKPNCRDEQRQGHGNQARFPNSRGRGHDRGRGSRPQNSFSRSQNYGQTPAPTPPPVPTPTPTFYRQDYVQNTSWQRPSSFDKAFAPRPSPNQSSDHQNSHPDNYYNYSSQNNNYYHHQETAYDNYSNQPWPNPTTAYPPTRYPSTSYPQTSYPPTASTAYPPSGPHQTHYYDNGYQDHGHRDFGINRGRGRGSDHGFAGPARGRGLGNSIRQPQHAATNSSPRQVSVAGHKPWVTPELLKMIRTRNAAESKANFTRNPADLYHFKKIRHKLASALSLAKFDYEIAQGSKKKSLFHCDPCDKSCFDQESLDAHKAEHMICKLDGCTFTAHPKVVVKHIQMQHSTDLYEKIAGYDTPEDIKVWICDRKNMYPTKENIERKRHERLERIARGERISKPGSRKFGTPGFVRRKTSAAAERNQELRRKRSGASTRPVSISGNKSEVVTLKSFYSTVKKNDKGVLEGKGLILWTNSTNLRKMTEKPDSDNGSDNEVEMKNNKNGYFTDEEEEPPAKTQKMGIGVSKILDTGKANSENKSVSAEKVDAINVKKIGQVAQPSSLLALVAYSSDSEMEDGEVRDDPEDTIPDTNIQTQTEVPTSSEPIVSINHAKRRHVSTKPSKQKLDDQARNVARVVSLACRRKASKKAREAVKRDLGKSNKHTKVTKKSYKVKKLLIPENEAEIKKEVATFVDQSSATGNVMSSEKGTQKESVEIDKSSKRRRVKPSQRKKPKIVNKRVRRPLMLEHLLAPEIRYERNQLLQICRFIVDNNFFDGSIVDSDDEDIPPRTTTSTDEAKAESVIPVPQTLESGDGVHGEIRETPSP